MSNRKKWSKCIKFKHKFRRDNVFKSYWIRKFLNKITSISKLNKTEYFMYNVFLKIKKLQLKKFNKKLFLIKKNNFYKFKKLKFRRIRYNNLIFQNNYLSSSFLIKKKKIFFFFWKNRETYFQHNLVRNIFHKSISLIYIKDYKKPYKIFKSFKKNFFYSILKKKFIKKKKIK